MVSREIHELDFDCHYAMLLKDEFGLQLQHMRIHHRDSGDRHPQAENKGPVDAVYSGASDRYRIVYSRLVAARNAVFAENGLSKISPRTGSASSSVGFAPVVRLQAHFGGIGSFGAQGR
jgi:hypothetical protein